VWAAGEGEKKSLKKEKEGEREKGELERGKRARHFDM